MRVAKNSAKTVVIRSNGHKPSTVFATMASVLSEEDRRKAANLKRSSNLRKKK